MPSLDVNENFEALHRKSAQGIKTNYETDKKILLCLTSGSR